MSRVLSSWKDKVSNHHQIGGIETSILNSGASKDVHVAWINTGSGLRYKVVLDRGMDILDSFFNQYSLSWISHIPISKPNPYLSSAQHWLTNFSGGLLTTCGLTHIGGPEEDEYGKRNLHGSVNNLPAEIESIIQPDITRGNLEMSITGRIREVQALGEKLELRRTISSVLGKSIIKIEDEVRNVGNICAPHMLLYHCNFGYPLVDSGTHILWKGKWVSRENNESVEIFKEGNDFHTCVEPLLSHNGGGEEAAFIDVEADEDGVCTAGLLNSELGLALFMRFRKDQLPWLTNWQHWGKGEYVTGIEPGTNPPIGQAEARRSNQLIFIEPGDFRKYSLEIEVVQGSNEIEKYLIDNNINIDYGYKTISD